VPEEGIEGTSIVEPTEIQGDSREDAATRVGVSAREPVGAGPTDPSVEAMLARALTRAAEAGQWDVAAQLVRELEARRLAGAGNVVRLPAERSKERA